MGGNYMNAEVVVEALQPKSQVGTDVVKEGRQVLTGDVTKSIGFIPVSHTYISRPSGPGGNEPLAGQAEVCKWGELRVWGIEEDRHHPYRSHGDCRPLNLRWEWGGACFDTLAENPLALTMADAPCWGGGVVAFFFPCLGWAATNCSRLLGWLLTAVGKHFRGDVARELQAGLHALEDSSSLKTADVGLQEDRAAVAKKPSRLFLPQRQVKDGIEEFTGGGNKEMEKGV